MATVWRRRLLPLVPVVAMLAVAVLVAFGPIDRGLSLKTLAQRFWFWENSLYLAREVPLTGAGLGLESVQLVYRAYFQPLVSAVQPRPQHLPPGPAGVRHLRTAGAGRAGAGDALGRLARPAGVGRWTMAGRLAGFGVALAMLTTGLTEIVLLSTLGGVLAHRGAGAAGRDECPHPRPGAGPRALQATPAAYGCGCRGGVAPPAPSASWPARPRRAVAAGRWWWARGLRRGLLGGLAAGWRSRAWGRAWGASAAQPRHGRPESRRALRVDRARRPARRRSTARSPLLRTAGSL